MITPITYEDIIKTLGKFLDEYSGLNPIRILNADSVRGTDLSQIISETEMYSPALSNSFLLFELLEDEAGEHFLTKGESEQEMIAIQTYNYHLMIYGNHAPRDAQRIASIFKNGDLAMKLRDSGIYIDGVSTVSAINEFINNTLIFRRDIDIKVQVAYKFDDIGDKPEYFTHLTEVITVLKSNN